MIRLALFHAIKTIINLISFDLMLCNQLFYVNITVMWSVVRAKSMFAAMSNVPIGCPRWPSGSVNCATVLGPIPHLLPPRWCRPHPGWRINYFFSRIAHCSRPIRPTELAVRFSLPSMTPTTPIRYVSQSSPEFY